MAASIIMSIQDNAIRETTNYLRQSNALSPQSAVVPSEAFLRNYELLKWRFKFIKITPEGKYWLDELELQKTNRQGYGLVVLMILIALIGVGYYILLTAAVIKP